MSEQELLKSKLIKHMVYNIIAFAVIFCIFVMFVFTMVKNITYSSVDNELYSSKNKLLELNSIYYQTNLIISGYDNRSVFIGNALEGGQNAIITRVVGSPKTTVILRNQQEEVLNQESLGPFREYIDQIDFDINNIEKIYEIKIDDQYTYRCINHILEIEESNQYMYVQLLINVDSEKNLINNYFEIISSAVIIGILLSIVASYVLSRKTLTPIQEMVIKQTEFVQNASHELRTPLTIIQAKQELLLQEPDSKIIDKSEDIVLTLNETKRLTKLTKDLMILARADSKSMNLQKENTNIDEFIENFSKPYMDIAGMQEKKILLNLEYKNDINIDTNRIYQLMIVLLDNAIKYTESGDTIEIHTYMKDNKCIIEVKDTGIGISDEGLKQVFDRFYREDEARNRETGGSGLGLSIALMIVNAHGGNIKASHNTPKGTVFTIRLPR